MSELQVLLIFIFGLLVCGYVWREAMSIQRNYTKEDPVINVMIQTPPPVVHFMPNYEDQDTEFEYVEMVDIIRTMNIKEFDEWLRTDIYGNVSDNHKEDNLLACYDHISSDRSISPDYEDYLLQRLKELKPR